MCRLANRVMGQRVSREIPQCFVVRVSDVGQAPVSKCFALALFLRLEFLEACHPITQISPLGLTAALRDQGKGSVNQLVVHNF
jgi:hypothetical protein